MLHVRVVRIVVASPSDVQAERNALPAVIEEINKHVADERGVRLELSRWENDAYAGFHADGPQGLIDAILRIQECDIFLGLFWKRFGTPTKDGATGTEHKFRLAPVTVVQFRTFVEQSGYQPRNKSSLQGLANHPVVRVSWHDALAYCRWLTERLQKGEGIPEALARRARQEGWEVTLLSEAEWEKAARGPATGSGEGLIYPWGNEW